MAAFFIASALSFIVLLCYFSSSKSVRTFFQLYPGTLRYVAAQLFPLLVKVFQTAERFSVFFATVVTTLLLVFSVFLVWKGLLVTLVLTATASGSLLLGFTLVTALMTVRFQRHRLEPHNYAASVFENGVRKGRILIVDNQYDVYLPPQYNNGRGENSRNPRVIDKALYFIPGTLLSPTVYAEVMAALSNKGILVIVRNTEPYFRLPDETFGLTMVDALTSIHDLKQRFAITVHEWSFGGHGHGGHVAAKIVQELWKEAPKDAIGMADKLVLWGLYSMESPVDLRPCSMKTLLVTATRDGFRPTGDEWTAELLSRLPVNTTLKDIPGGNHSGFGTYGPQRFYRQDGARYISLYEQHRQIVQATAVFLGGTKPYSKKKKTSSLNHTPKHCWKCTS